MVPRSRIPQFCVTKSAMCREYFCGPHAVGWVCMHERGTKRETGLSMEWYNSKRQATVGQDMMRMMTMVRVCDNRSEARALRTHPEIRTIIQANIEAKASILARANAKTKITANTVAKTTTRPRPRARPVARVTRVNTNASTNTSVKSSVKNKGWSASSASAFTPVAAAPPATTTVQPIKPSVRSHSRRSGCAKCSIPSSSSSSTPSPSSASAISIDTAEERQRRKMSRSMEVRKRVGPIMERMKKSLIKIQDLEDSLLRQDGRQHHDDADKSATTMTKHACVDDCASSCSTLTAASVGLPLAVISEDEPLTEAQQRMALSKRQSSSSSMSSSLSSSLSSAASVSSTSGASAGSPKRSRSNRSRSSNDSKPPKTKLSKRDALMKRSMEMLRNKMSQLQQMEMCILEAEDRTIQLNQMVVHQSQMVDQHAICKIELTQARDVQEELLHKLERASDHHERLMEFKQSRIDDLERQVQMLTARLKALGTVESDLKISIKFQRRLQHQLQERQELVDKQTKRADDLQLQVEILTNQCKLHQQQLVKEYAINAQHRQATNKPRSLHSRNNSNIRNNDDDDELLLHQPYPLTMQIDNMSNLSDTSIETPFSGSSYQQTGLTPESSQKANQTTTIKNTKSSRRNLRSMFGGSRRNKAKQKKKATTMTVESTTATTVNNATASSKTPVAEKRRCVSPQNTPPITPHTTPEKVTPEKTPVVVQHHQPAVPIVTTSFDHSDVSHLTADEPETALSDTSLSDNQQLVDVVQQPRQEVSTSQTETLKENDNATSIPQQQHEELKVEKTTTDGATPQEQPQESKKTDQVTPQEQQEQQEPQQEPQQEMTDEVSPQEQPQQEPKEDDKAISNPEPTTTVDEVMPEQQPKPEKQKKNQPSFFRQLMQTTDAYQLKKLLEQK